MDGERPQATKCRMCQMYFEEDIRLKCWEGWQELGLGGGGGVEVLLRTRFLL